MGKIMIGMATLRSTPVCFSVCTSGAGVDADQLEAVVVMYDVNEAAGPLLGTAAAVEKGRMPGVCIFDKRSEKACMNMRVVRTLQMSRVKPG